MIYEAAHWLGVVPLLWLVGLALGGQRVRAAEWWLAAAFGVSWLADTVPHAGFNPDLAGNLYPMTQAGIVALVLLDRGRAAHVIGLLLVTATVAVAWQGTAGYDVLLSTVAGGLIAGLAWTLPPLLRWSLIIAFGGSAAVGCLAVLAPGPATGLLYQSTRLAGTVLFCAAVSSAIPASPGGPCRTTV